MLTCAALAARAGSAVTDGRANPRALLPTKVRNLRRFISDSAAIFIIPNLEPGAQT